MIFPTFRLALLVGISWLLLACGGPARSVAESTGNPHGTGGINNPDQRTKPYLVLLSIDGFRWDYLDRYPVPNMRRLVASGSRAERLLPVFPTLTFPNHYSLATGLYPAHHGLVANDFPDPVRNTWYSLKNRETVEDRWFYAGEPVWVVAETQGMVAAAFYFVGTEAPIMGVSPTYWRSYDKKVAGEERVDQVLAWLALPEDSRPHLLTLYFEDVDDYSHWKGPDSEENIAAIGRVDAYLGRLLQGIEKLPVADRVNIMLVSDHGLAAYAEEPSPFILEEFVPVGGAVIVEGGSYLFMHFDKTDPGRVQDIVATVNRDWQHGTAYTVETAPPQWQLDDNPRFPDVILMPEVGYAVFSTHEKSLKISAGDHGWAPEAKAMHGFFVASGPNIKPGVNLGLVNSVDIYALMLTVLGLDIPPAIDGDREKLPRMLHVPDR